MALFSDESSRIVSLLALFQAAELVTIACSSSLISRDEFYALQSEKFVNDTFEGSLPAFVTAFASRNKLTEAEAAELRRIIDGMEE